MSIHPAGEPIELAGDWPPGLPTGECITSWRDGELHIDHADPRILISALIVDEAAFGLLKPRAELVTTGENIANGFIGALLKLHAANRNVIYRLTEWLPAIRAYIGEWPE
jgi:hypothetical protein